MILGGQGPGGQARGPGSTVKAAAGGCPYVVCQAAGGGFVVGWGL